MAIVVRWLDAFISPPEKGEKSKEELLENSFDFEFCRTDECAAERLEKTSKIRHASVGLLVKREAVVRRFPKDVWSVKDSGGKLRPTRRPSQVDSIYGHQEVFIKPQYIGVVVKKSAVGYKLAIAAKMAQKYEVPLFVLDSAGVLHKVF